MHATHQFCLLYRSAAQERGTGREEVGEGEREEEWKEGTNLQG